MHQGIGLQIPPYKYADFRELMDRAKDAGEPGMFVILDSIKTHDLVTRLLELLHRTGHVGHARLFPANTQP